MANRERVALGVAALRSRNPDGSPVYPKGRMKLHRINSEGKSSWCCLGVLSRVAIEGGCPVTSEIAPVPLYEPGSGMREIFGEETEFLAPEIQVWYEFDSFNPELRTPEGNTTTATTWNDFGNDEFYVSDPEEDFDAIADAFARTYLDEPA